MGLICPCRELDELRRFKAAARRQMTEDEKRIKEMEAEILILGRRHNVCNSVFQSVWAENKRLQELAANAEQLVRCEKCKHRIKDQHAGNVRYICKHPKGLTGINKQSFCSYGGVDNGEN